MAKLLTALFINDSLAEKQMNTLQDTKSVLAYIVSSRTRLARNLKNYRFPYAASDAERETVGHAVTDAIRQAAKHSTRLHGVRMVSLDQLNSFECQFLAEEHRISPLCAQQHTGCLAIFANTDDFSIFVNEEDHLRIQAILPGFRLRETWKITHELENSLGNYLDFAHSEQHGYLTTCPSNTGTGLRASVMMFLPGLIMLKRMTPILKHLVSLGVTVRGRYGEGSETQGYLLQIANQVTYGEHGLYSATAILRGIEQMSRRMIKAERHARHDLLNSRKRMLVQQITQAYEQLSTMKQIPLETSIRMLALLRLGICLGIGNVQWMKAKPDVAEQAQALQKIDTLYIQIQPAHILRNATQPCHQKFDGNLHADAQDDEDALRAKLIQQMLSDL